MQARLHLVFAKFRELQSARRVMRYLGRNGLSLPVRPLLGPSPHEVVWRASESGRVLSILSSLCWGVCLWSPAKGSEPMPAWIVDGNGQGSDRRLAGLPPRRSHGLYQLGGVHGQPAPTGR
ncbi:hypothetical protein J2R78_008536 [Bradyrhizobium sp. USDA 4538]|nr:hypothetical protein [Bradyrhizobium sp. USDA 4538]MCP1907176.1 hypothetical protein [Bradyrhizobium sp. USDA 4537]MCP1985652.1 hypothetical protein [Bradyrhizobium sp. USDA 4539]